MSEIQVQFTSGHHIHGTQDLQDYVQSMVKGALEHVHWKITRVNVHMQDQNAGKGGVDKKCTVEARLAEHQPIAVTHEGENFEQALSGALDKMARALEHTVGRLHDKK